MPTLWMDLNHYEQINEYVKFECENGRKEWQAVISLIEKFIEYVRQHGGQAGTAGLPIKKMKNYDFSSLNNQANSIMEILQYSLTMCKQSPEKVRVSTAIDKKYEMLGLLVHQGSTEKLTPYFVVAFQYNLTTKEVKCEYFYNSQEWDKTEKGGN